MINLKAIGESMRSGIRDWYTVQDNPTSAEAVAIQQRWRNEAIAELADIAATTPEDDALMRGMAPHYVGPSPAHIARLRKLAAYR